MSASSSTSIAPDRSESSYVQTSPAQGSRSQSEEQVRVRGHLLLWSWIGLLTIAGFLGVSPQLAYLWEVWTADPLRSIGMFILPTSIVLILRVWRQYGWELHGSWWGLLLVGLAFAPLICARRLDFFWAAGGITINFIPSVFPICLYVTGILLLFAGPRVWRSAWFPLALLLCLQPVPQAFVQFLDIPMQGFSANVARMFASLLGFSPTKSELLRLMFTPDFGMFIAPGCDGMRGAVTLGYVALIVGYLKRVSLLRWAAYVVGGFLLGHLFNLIRLCALVLYYRIAMGHVVLEHAAKRADYVIGGLLFLVAVYLFRWIVLRNQSKRDSASIGANSSVQNNENHRKLTCWRAALLSLFVFAAMVATASAIRGNLETFDSALRRGEISQQELSDRIPSQVGDYRLVRVWQEQDAGALALEAAVFEKVSSPEIEMGIWLLPSDHSIRQSLRTQGETPKTKAIRSFTMAAGQPVQVNTAFYDDGVTETFTGDLYCSPSACRPGYTVGDGIHLAIPRIIDHRTRGKRAIPIFLKLQVPHTGSATETVYQALSKECQDFLANLDLYQLSQRFQ